MVHTNIAQVHEIFHDSHFDVDGGEAGGKQLGQTGRKRVGDKHSQNKFRGG